MNHLLTVYVPASRDPEHRWIVKTILSTYLGLDISIRPHDNDTIIITDGDERLTLTLPSILLTTNPTTWSASSAVPQRVAHWIDQTQLPWDAPQKHVAIPALYAKDDPASPQLEDGSIYLPWDLFGSAFFMLTRLEEILLDDADEHGRFPASASLAVREGFERIPVVNAWGEILWGALQRLWPNLQRKQHTYRVLVSHDVDWPLVSNKLPLRQVLKSSAGDIVVRKSPVVAARRLLGTMVPEPYRPKINPGNTFDFIMRESERHGISSAFYFIPENTAGQIDGTYLLAMPFIQETLRQIHARGHEVGIHPGYNTFRSPERVASGFQALLAAAHELSIEQNTWGGRQHYLRWSAAETWRHWAKAGLTYDSTLGYAETVGFRVGACFEYPVFDVLSSRELPLIERPLIVMEGALFGRTSPINLALTDDDGLIKVMELCATTSKYAGDFTLLWHNSSLITKAQRDLYRATLHESICN